MKISLNTQWLRDTLKKVLPLVPKMTPRPIIKNILLEGNSEALTLTATDLDTTVKIINRKVDYSDEFKILLPCRKLLLLLQLYKQETILEIDLDSRDMMEWKLGNIKIMVEKEDASEFPRFKQKPEISIGMIDVKQVIDLYSGVEGFNDNDKNADKRLIPILWIRNSTIGQRMVATNGHYMAMATIPNEGPDLEIKVKPLAFKFLKYLDGEIELWKKEETWALTTDTWEIILSENEDSYPLYEKVIPKEWTTQVIFSTSQLQEFLYNMSGFLRKSPYAQILTLFNSNTRKCQFEILPESGSKEKIHLSLPVEIKGENLEIRFNLHYLCRCLEKIKSDKTVLDLTGDLSACVIYGQEKKADQMYLIMPIMV